MGNSFIVKQGSSGGGSSSSLPYMVIPCTQNYKNLNLGVLKELLISKGVDESLFDNLYGFQITDKYFLTRGDQEYSYYAIYSNKYIQFPEYGYIETRTYNPAQTEEITEFAGTVELETSMGYGAVCLVVPLEWIVGYGGYDNPQYKFVSFTEAEIESFLYD